ncbi:MAG TPA: heavy metal-associated domain-containing protein [Oscillospiraceae bacterium]|nr:heavy metal-associated domain-containing protein [Oscillospiraceae bacterium]HPF55269.1 heavy metal-associated domain-containing protein [Clostridiales bacterium]HPK36006.1 heavy metal-associated domain-containing protein [Oscillospiraceae bacterium]
MKTLKVPDMHCQMCVERISKALTGQGIAFKVDLATKTVEVEDAKAAAAIETLDDIGFSAQE